MTFNNSSDAFNSYNCRVSACISRITFAIFFPCNNKKYKAFYLGPNKQHCLVVVGRRRRLTSHRETHRSCPLPSKADLEPPQTVVFLLTSPYSWELPPLHEKEVDCQPPSLFFRHKSPLTTRSVTQANDTRLLVCVAETLNFSHH
ncbi:unnamed protein product [Cochlearia groenlandica]